MNLTHLLNAPLATSTVAALLIGGMVVEEQGAGAEPTEAVAVESENAESQAVRRDVEGDVQEAAQEEVARHRKDLVDDAVEALGETHEALKALDEGDAEAALESLAVANGKLDLVVARNASMALAPVDVRVITHDLFATVEDIERVRKKALRTMKDGRLQETRALIENLRSDVVIEVVNVPLATYPAAIRAITPLIDDGKIEEAKAGLQRALNTLVVTETVYPLPAMRAQSMLARAEELAETEERSEEEAEELTRLLDGARYQLEFADALGYGEEDDYRTFYHQLDQIEEKTSDGKSGEGFFDKIREALRVFGDSDSVSS